LAVANRGRSASLWIETAGPGGKGGK
jgi:hypothetical protein